MCSSGMPCSNVSLHGKEKRKNVFGIWPDWGNISKHFLYEEKTNVQTTKWFSQTAISGFSWDFYLKQNTECAGNWQHYLLVGQFILKKLNIYVCLSEPQLYQNLLALPSSRRPQPPASPSPGILVIPTLCHTTLFSTEPKGRTANTRPWTASPPPATALGGSTPTLSTRSGCQLSTASARVPHPPVWRLVQENKPLPALHKASRLTSFLRTVCSSAGKNLRSPMGRWAKDSIKKMCIPKMTERSKTVSFGAAHRDYVLLKISIPCCFRCSSKKEKGNRTVHSKLITLPLET